MAATSTDRQYTHSSLPERSVRLLKLVKQESGAIALSLTTYLLSEAPEFNCLSYVWGPASNTRSVSMLDQQGFEVGTLQIPHSVFRALPFLKAASGRPIWIDAVCINQRDQTERARVVPQMGDLYSKAAEVLIWLGPEQDESDLAMDVLNWLWLPEQRELIEQSLCTPERLLRPAQLKAMLSVLTGGASITNAATDIERYGIPTIRNPVWSALPALYRRNWFYRVWTFQEIMLAGKATVLCGDRAIPWEAFRQLGDRLSDSELLWISQPSGQRTFSPLRDLQNLHRDGEWFWHYLRGARDRSCEFKEDRLYGMLALAPHSIVANLPVVYNREDPDNFIQVYRNAAVLFIQELSLETVLVEATCTGLVREVPSWCPDWSLQSLSNPVPARFRADPAHESLRQWSEDGCDRNILHVRGLQVDTVTQVIDDYSYHWPTGVAGIDGPAHKMLQWLGRCKAMSRSTFGFGQAAHEALWKTLVAHSDIHNQHNYPPDPVRGLAAHVKRLAENRDSIPFSQTALTQEDVQALGPYIAYVGVLWPGKVLFCTQNGTIGLANKGIAARDKICMLFGTGRYFALRRRVENTHSLISVAYVHGLMNDATAALDPLNTRESFEVNAQIFHLR